MTPERWRRVREIFERAITLPRGEIEAWLSEACAGDDELRGDVVRLLKSDAAAGASLEPPPRSWAAADATSMPARRVGSFTLQRPIGSGGMGTVYEAVQEHPRRTVALKILRLGLASPTAVRRFRFEAEVLGRLQHPGIAQVFEAGTHSDGGAEVPYFAMEFVDGARDVLDYAAAHGLDWRARVELFLQICDAVNHGHQKGVIHRDLKPSNLLVDPSGRVKIIDFGIARATGADSSVEAATLATEPGQIVGTLQYMSPERFESTSGAADTRSDVYSLGVVLFELLCGSPPHALDKRSITEVARIVRDEPPRRPTTVEPRLPRDLEWILLRALEREPDRRYASASELASDLRRHLASEPVVAGPPSATYRMRKFVARHRAAVGATIAIGVLLVAGLAGTTIGWRRALEQERVARDEARRSNAIKEIMKSLVAVASPQNSGPDVTVVQALDSISTDVERFFEKQPDLLVMVLEHIAHVFYDIGHWDKALVTAKRAVEIGEQRLGPDDVDLAIASNTLGLVHHRLQHLDEAYASYQRAEGIFRRRGLVTDTNYLSARENCVLALYGLGQKEQATSMLEDIVASNTQSFGPDDPKTLGSKGNLADLYRVTGRLDDALRLSTEVIERRRATEPTRNFLVQLHNRAQLLGQLHRREEAVALEREVLEEWRRTLGNAHPHVGSSLENLAIYEMAVGEIEAAERDLRELASREFGSDPGQVRQARMRRLFFATVLTARERFDEAEPILAADLSAEEERAESDLFVGMAVAAAGRIRLARGDAVEAERLIRRGVTGVTKKDKDWPWRLVASWLAECLRSTGRAAEAQALLADLPAAK